MSELLGWDVGGGGCCVDKLCRTSRLKAVYVTAVYLMLKSVRSRYA
jgi:hypothetical protein